MLKEEHRQLLVAAAEKIGTELSPDSVENFPDTENFYWNGIKS